MNMTNSFLNPPYYTLFTKKLTLSAYSEAVIVHVQNKVLAHHGQPNQANISPEKTNKKKTLYYL